MRLGLFLKVAALTAALFMVITISRGLNTNTVEKAFQALGIEPGTPNSPGFQPGGQPLAPGEERFNICRTRIVSFAWSPERRIEEKKEGLKLIWLAYSPDAREIGTIEVEKWLSLHCQIRIKPIDGVIESESSPKELTLSYVDGSKAVIRRYAGARYDLRELGEARPVRSLDFEAALAELEAIGGFQAEAGSKGP
jgi:hypothetical protein